VITSWNEADLLEPETWDHFSEAVESAADPDVRRALASEELGPRDLAALLSPAASEHLDEMARRAREITLRRFGRVVVLYVPFYLSNECVNHCTYCYFAHDVEITRSTLSPGQLDAEVARLKAARFDHVLLLTGEDRRAVPPGYIRDAVATCHGRFSSVGVEIYPMSRGEYADLVQAGCDAITLYQETYHPPSYAAAHPRGPKRDFAARLGAPSLAADAGMRSVGIGALLGLADWRVEGLCMAAHGKALRRDHWRSRLSIGFPRLREGPGALQPLQPLSEADLAQLLWAMRLTFPDADLVLSTRERPQFRDPMVGLGVTRMSAGSKTQPGGYAGVGDAGEQFAITDDRSPAEVAAMIEARGCEAVWKDWDREFLA
jgi:2-iminoacetate synthase